MTINDIGLYHVVRLGQGGVRPSGSVLNARDLFTVEEGMDTHIYERPHGAGAVEIRRAVAVAFIDSQNYASEYRVAGRYPNYRIEEV
jgi:hypothetical protein